MKKKGLLAVSLLATASLALTACGDDSDKTDSNSSDGGSDTIRVWLNGTDTPQEARDYLTKTFADQNPGKTLKIEEQQWDGLVEKLTTSLSSASETPDVVEVGNTQAATFTSAGAFADVSDDLAGWGGDDLLPGFVEAGTYDGKTYAVPYYAGSKYVFYRKDLFQKAGIKAVPTTTEEFIADAIALKKDNPKPANFSGFWLPGQDWRNGVAFVWNAGGELATDDGGTWKSTLSSPESVAGLETVQKLFTEASGAPKDGNEADPQTPFCAGEVGMVSAPGWVQGLLTDPKNGCPDLFKKVGVFALPGATGDPAPVLLGGSNIAVSAKSENQDLARSAVTIMLSDEYQTILAKNGLTPAKLSLLPQLGNNEFSKATIAAASNARLTPAAPGWAAVEGSHALEDLFSGIASGGDVAKLAAEADAKIDPQLNG